MPIRRDRLSHRLPHRLSPGGRTPSSVSVLTPSYAYARFIEDAVKSVLRQSHVETTHVVQDAASRDGTQELLRKYGSRVDWRSEPDSGQSDALNKALRRSTHPWIAWLNADEFYLPQALSMLVEAGNRTGADVVYGDAIFVDESGRLLRLLAQHPFSRVLLKIYGPFIPSCALLMRRDILEEHPWDTRLRRVMDWELYLSLADKGARFHYVPYPVGAFRVHHERVTARPIQDFSSDYELLKERYGIRLRLRPAGRIPHGAYKLMTGAYRRQVRAHAFRGQDLRWFESETTSAAVNRLREVCYRLRPPSANGPLP
jgi:glycosyltransferase involved in cell wall biosynthesis